MAEKLPLTPKQARYIENLKTANTKREAALSAGYASETADNAKQHIEDRIAESVGQSAFIKLMEEAGLTDEYLADKLKEGTQATKLFGKDAIEHPDYAAQHRFVETSLKIKQRIADNPAAPTVNNTQVNIQVMNLSQGFTEYLKNVGTATKPDPTD